MTVRYSVRHTLVSGDHTLVTTELTPEGVMRLEVGGSKPGESCAAVLDDVDLDLLLVALCELSRHRRANKRRELEDAIAAARNRGGGSS